MLVLPLLLFASTSWGPTDFALRSNTPERSAWINYRLTGKRAIRTMMAEWSASRTTIAS